MSFGLKVVFPCLFVMMGLVFIAIGGRGIATRKPFLLSARWFLGIGLLGLAPGVVMPFLLANPRTGGALDLLPWLNPAMFVVVAISMWLSLRGYMAFGVTDVSFREGLLAALDELQLPHEETLGSMKLPSVGADLQISVQSAMGMAATPREAAAACRFVGGRGGRHEQILSVDNRRGQPGRLRALLRYGCIHTDCRRRLRVSIVMTGVTSPRGWQFWFPRD